MSERHLFTVTGLPGSGKTTLLTSLANDYGIEVRNIGDELAQIYRHLNGLESSVAVTGLERMKVHKLVRQTDPGYFRRFITDEICGVRAIDGLRNYVDALHLIRHGGFVVSLVAPRPIRIVRRLHDNMHKDPSLEALMARELSELNDSDPDGAQALRVMAMAHDHGFFVDASQGKEQVLTQVLTGFEEIGVTL